MNIFYIGIAWVLAVVCMLIASFMLMTEYMFFAAYFATMSLAFAYLAGLLESDIWWAREMCDVIGCYQRLVEQLRDR